MINIELTHYIMSMYLLLLVMLLCNRVCMCELMCMSMFTGNAGHIK